MRIRLPKLPKFPRNLRLGTLQLVALIAACLCSVAVLAVRGFAQSSEMERGSADQAELRAETAALRAEIRNLKEIDRIVSALRFLSQGKLAEEDLVQTSKMLRSLSRSAGFDPLLILAVVSVESRGNPLAQGKFHSGTASGAIGLMQIKYETARRVGRKIGVPIQRESDLLKPEVNLLYGTAFLLQMTQRYGSLQKGLIAYNIGPGTLEEKMSARHRLPRRYWNRVLSNYRALVNRFGEDPFQQSENGDGGLVGGPSNS